MVTTPWPRAPPPGRAAPASPPLHASQPSAWCERVFALAPPFVPLSNFCRRSFALRWTGLIQHASNPPRFQPSPLPPAPLVSTLADFNSTLSTSQLDHSRTRSNTPRLIAFALSSRYYILRSIFQEQPTTITLRRIANSLRQPRAFWPKIFSGVRNSFTFNMATSVDPDSSTTSGLKRKRDAGSKFYAVRVGHKPGIYHSWSDCLAQVKGFKGAACMFSCLASNGNLTDILSSQIVRVSHRRRGVVEGRRQCPLHCRSWHAYEVLRRRQRPPTGHLHRLAIRTEADHRLAETEAQELYDPSRSSSLAYPDSG